MIIRKALADDIERIEAIYDRIHDEEEVGNASIGWARGVYPTRATAEASYEREDLFVMEDEGVIVAAAIINQIQVPEYRLAHWKYDVPDNEIMVLHTLVVDPLQGAKEYGKAFVAYYEEYARHHCCHELRMDTNAVNARARKMYAGLGYEEVGIIDCVFNGIPDVKLVCIEKKAHIEIAHNGIAQTIRAIKALPATAHTFSPYSAGNAQSRTLPFSEPSGR